METLEQSNVSLLKRLNPTNPTEAAELFAPSFVWHFFNPRLPELEGNYEGLTGLQAFFEKLGALTDGTFHVEPVSLTPFGDELVVAHVKDVMTLDGRQVETDAVVVWRIVGSRITEAWDIPSVYAANTLMETPTAPNGNPIP